MCSGPLETNLLQLLTVQGDAMRIPLWQIQPVSKIACVEANSLARKARS
jgi:hypothetical protein